MKKIVTIIGARPQFIKAAVVSRELRKKNKEIIIHTGQHYDKNMSDIFFKQLGIPEPNYNLGIGGGTHGFQTGNMIVEIEKILIKEKPDFVLVYGDTNSTLAGALSASKLLIPVVHIEAGLRSYNMKMPEEQNRILTDHLSKILFASTEDAIKNLKSEGIVQNVYNVGDVMCDSVLYYSNQVEKNIKLNLISLYEKKKIERWYLATIHRAENTENDKNLKEILKALNRLDDMVIFPVHPRIRKMVDELTKQNHYNNIYFVEPVDYLTMLYLTKNAIKVVTDSGGLQKECYILDVPCITVRDQTEWVETLKNGYNVLSKPYYNELFSKINHAKINCKNKINYYGDGHSAKKIVDIINKFKN